MTDKLVVLVTCSSAAEARRIAQAVVEARLAACVNILPGAVTSIYRWKGKVESARERLLLIKTSRNVWRSCARQSSGFTPMMFPSSLRCRLSRDRSAYLAWLEESLEKSSG